MKQVLTLLFLSSLSLSFAQTTVNLNPAKDNTLYQNSSGTVSNGSGHFLFAGRTGQGSDFRRRAVLQFDLSSIPPTAQITGVTLALTVNNTKSGAHVMKVHRLTSDWGEGASNAGSPGGTGASAQNNDATWLHSFFPNTSWNNAGGDFVSTASATNIISSVGTYTWAGNGLVNDVQSWLNGSNPNYGFILVGDENTSQSASRFASRESSTSKPILSVTYTLPCIDPDLPTISFNPVNPCPGDSVWLIPSGNLNSATQWVVYDGACGQNHVGSTTDSIKVATSNSTDFFVRGEGGCVSPGNCTNTNPNYPSIDYGYFSYPSLACADGSILTPDSITQPGGTFSSATVAVNPNTGSVSLSTANVGAHLVTYTTSGACADVYTVPLVIGEVFQDTTLRMLCAGDSLFIQGAYQTTDGVYTDSLQSSTGCDSLITLDLRFRNEIQAFTNPFICGGDSIFLQGGWQDTSGTYIDTLMSSAGCDSIIYSSLTVFPQDTAQISLPRFNFCPTDSIVRVLNTSNNTGIYAVSPSNGLQFNSSTGEIDFSQSVPNMYTILFLTSGTCHDTSTVSFRLHPNTTGHDSVNLCEGDFILFGGQTIDTAGNYSAVFSSVNGCDSTVFLNVEVTVVDTSVTINSPVLGDAFANDATADSYLWLDCDNNPPTPVTTTVNNQFTLTNPGPGIYAVVVEKNGCFDTSRCYILSPIGLEEKQNSFDVYPNPASETLKFSNLVSAEEFSIYNLQGQLINSGDLSLKLEEQIDVSYLETGMYLIEIRNSGNEQFLSRFIKQ